MKKLFILLTALLALGVSGAWAGITWETKSGWEASNGGYASMYWFGAHTPGTTTDSYYLTSISICESNINGINSTPDYLAIATANSNSSLSASSIVAISNNNPTATATDLAGENVNYTFDGKVKLTGGTTYYLVFLSSNVQTDGAYPVTTQRLLLNHLGGYGTYEYGNSAGQSGWWFYYCATLEDYDSPSTGSLTYRYKVGDVSAGTEVVSVTDGYVYPTPTALGKYTSVTTPSGYVTSSTFDTTVDVSITWSGFDFADSYNHITQWYTVRMNSNETHYMYSNISTATISFSNTLASNDNRYLWGFVGNPVDGFQIYNYNKGSGFALDNSSPCTLSASGKSINLKITNGTAGSQGSSADTYFAMYLTAGNYFNYNSGNIGRHNAADAGSTVMINTAAPASPILGSTNETPIYYAWQSSVNNNPSYVYWNGSAVRNDKNNVELNEANPISDAYAWQFIGNAIDGYVIKNKQTGTYLGGQTTTGQHLNMENTAQSYFIPVETTVATYYGKGWYCKTYNYFIDRSGGYPHSHTAGNINVFKRLYQVKFTLSNDDGGLQIGSSVVDDFDTKYLITTSASLSCTASGYSITAYDGYDTLAEALENDDDGTINLTIQQTVDVTYNLTWNGSPIASKTTVKSQIVGADVLAATTVFGAAPAYCSYGDPGVTTIGESTTTVNVALNWSGPFTFSANYESAVWYYWALNDKWARNHDTKWTAPALESDIASVKGTDGALWAFLGNPCDGIFIILKEKYSGSEVYLSSGSSNPDFWNEVGSTEKWTVKKLSATTFTLNCGDKYLIDTSNRMAFKTTALEGSEGTFSVRSYYCQEAINDVNTWATANHLDEYFGIDPTCLTTIGNMFVTMFSNMDKSTYDGIVIPRDITKNLVTKYPTAGYYRIKNNATGNYIGYGQPTATGSTKEKGLITMSADDAAINASSIIYLAGSAGTYRLSTEGLNVQAQTTANQAFPADNNATGVDFVFTHDNFGGIASITNAASNVDTNNDGSLHEATEDWTVHGVVNYSASSANSKWVIEDATTVTITLHEVGGKSYATMCLPFDVELPEPNIDMEHATMTGTFPYIVEIVGQRAQLTLKQVTKIPAGIPVLLINTEGVSSVDVTITTGASALSGTNNLAGTYVDKNELAGNEYILATKSGEIGFWKLGANAKVGANKAYLVVPNGDSTVKGFSLDFSEVTGLSEIAGSTQKAQIFDLSGRRVNEPARGLYIVNGKKVLVK